MKRVDRYLLAESLPPLLFGLLLYSGLAVVSVTIPRLQWVVGTPLPQLGEWLALQLPAAVVQTLPIALVLAVLLAFGRLAGTHELLALQAGAVPLFRVSLVFVGLGLAAAGGALALNQWALPAANARVGSLYWELTSGASGLFRLASQNIPIAGMSLHFESVDGETDELLGVRIERWQDRQLTVLFAERARFEPRGLRLFGYRTTVLDLSALDEGDLAAREALGRLVRLDSRAASDEAGLLLTLDAGQEELVTRFSGGGFEDPRSIADAYRDARDPALDAAARRAAAVLLHRKVAEPFASLALLLVAVPLAVLYGRSRSVAFGLSLVVTLAWYLLLTIGQLLAQTGTLPVWLGVWGGNLALALVGLTLLWRRVELR